MPTPSSEALAHDLLAILPLLARLVAAEVRHEAGDETTMPQFRVLSHLAEGPLTLTTLARRRQVSLQSMGELVQSLVERGWLVRTPDPSDRRQSLLALTEVGRQHFEHVQVQTLARLAPLLEELSEAERNAVQLALPALQRVLVREEELNGGH